VRDGAPLLGVEIVEPRRHRKPPQPN